MTQIPRGHNPYGHDFGNGETDDSGIIGDTLVSCSLPTAEADAPSTKRIKNFGVDLGAQTILFRMKGESTTHMIGEGAFTQAHDFMSHRNNTARYTTPSSLRALLANSTRTYNDPQYTLHVVTGVPVKTFAEDDTIRQKITDALNGEYTFTVNGNDERHVKVIVEKVIAEGAGAIIAYGEKDPKVLQGVIDIGGKTTDLFVARGQRPLLDRCTSIDIGVERAIDRLKAIFEENHGRPLRQEEARAIMFAYADGDDYPIVDVKGKTVGAPTLAHLAKEVVDKTGREITSAISAVWNEGDTTGQIASSYRRVIVVGRGVLFFKKYIQQILSEEQYRSPKDPGSANAHGYALLARSSLRERYSV